MLIKKTIPPRLFRLNAMMIGFLFAVNSSAVEAKQAWVFGQTSDYYGKMTLVVGDAGCKLVSDRLGVTVLSSAPAWHVCILNTRKKQFLEMTAEQWAKRVGRKASAPLKLKGLKPAGSGVIAGLQAVKYLAFNPRLRDKERNREYVVDAENPGQTSKYNTEIWVAPAIKPPRKLGELTEGLTASAYDLGFVMKVVNFPGTAQKLTALDTLKAEKKMISAGEFETPKGYRRAKDELSLMMDEDSVREADSILFDDSAPTGKVKASDLRTRLR